jgi:predicted MFS family arabinose efflux permease
MPSERYILLWMCILIAVNQLGFGAVIPVLPLYAQAFGVSASAIGMTIAVYGLARFVAALPSGRLCDVLGRRPTLAFGGLLTALGNLWCALATGYTEFLLARFVAGLGAGVVVLVGQIILADITTPQRRGRTLAIYQAVFLFAVGIGPFPGGLLAQQFGLSAPFWAYGIAGLLVGLIAWFAVPETRQSIPAQRSTDPLPQTNYRQQMRLLLRHNGFVLVSLISLMHAFTRTGGLFNIIPILGNTWLGLSVADIGLALAIGSVAGILSAYPAGMVSDRFGRKAVIVPATLTAGAAFLLFGLVGSFTGFIVAAVLWSIASSAGSSAPAAYAADSAPAGMNATAMSMFRMVSDAGYVIGPIVLGFLADSYGAGTALVIAAAMIILIAIAFAVYAPESYRGSGNV